MGAEILATRTLLIAGGLGLFLLGAYRVKAAVAGALFLAVFEGVVRKWLLPDLGQPVYFAKDILLLGGYVGSFGPRIVRREPIFEQHPASVGLALLLLLSLCQVANPALANPGVGLFGLKAYLFDAPLLYLVGRACPDVRQVRTLWLAFLACAAIPLVLGIMQFSAPADSELNRYAWQDEIGTGAVSTFGESSNVRITGTFAYISGYTVYLTVVVLMAFPVVVSERNRWIWGGSYLMLVLALGNLFMTGSRGPFLMLAVGLVVLLMLAYQHGAFVGSQAALVVVVMFPVAVVMAQNVFPEAWGAFFERVTENEDVGERVSELFSNPVPAVEASGLLGFGIGSTHQAATFLIPDGAAYTRPPEAEGEWERIVLELGPLGLVLVLVVRIAVVWRLWIAYASSRNAMRRWFLATALLFTAACLPGNLVFNHTASVFYWFFAGLALIPEKEQSVARSNNVPQRGKGRPDWDRGNRRVGG